VGAEIFYSLHCQYCDWDWLKQEKLFFRVPKAFRAAKLQAKKYRTPRLQDRKIGALGLHGCNLGLHLSKIKSLYSGLHDKNFRAPGFQGPPFETWILVHENERCRELKK